jgi:predicted nucleotidyltransferase
MRELMNIVESEEQRQVLNEQIFYNGKQHPLHAVLEELRANPLAPFVRVFGSAAVKPLKKIPGDIDIFVDASRVTLSREERKQGTRALLQTAHKHYGYLDPFILITKKLMTDRGDGKPHIQRTLYVRDEYATSWVPAKNAGAIIRAGMSGTPLSDLQEFDLAERAPPTRKGERFIRKHKAEFKDRYGDNWKGVLYATAWKLFGEDK